MLPGSINAHTSSGKEGRVTPKSMAIKAMPVRRPLSGQYAFDGQSCRPLTDLSASSAASCL